MRTRRRGSAIAALVLVTALVAACATTSPGSAAADQVLAGAIYAKLNANPTYYYRHVDVTVDQGIAQLTGYVWSTDALYAARRIARSVPGVTGVVTSQLELERNGRGNGAAR